MSKNINISSNGTGKTTGQGNHEKRRIRCVQWGWERGCVSARIRDRKKSESCRSIFLHWNEPPSAMADNYEDHDVDSNLKQLEANMKWLEELSSDIRKRVQLPLSSSVEEFPTNVGVASSSASSEGQSEAHPSVYACAQCKRCLEFVPTKSNSCCCGSCGCNVLHHI